VPSQHPVPKSEAVRPLLTPARLQALGQFSTAFGIVARRLAACIFLRVALRRTLIGERRISANKMAPDGQNHKGRTGRSNGACPSLDAHNFPPPPVRAQSSQFAKHFALVCRF
jgi:hypothetical protein